MRPANVFCVFLGVVGVGVWFVFMPLAAAQSEDLSTLGAFALVWGITIGMVLILAGVIWLDNRWLKRHRSGGEQ